MPGGSKKGGGLTTKKSAFYLKSGNRAAYSDLQTHKESPVKYVQFVAAVGKVITAVGKAGKAVGTAVKGAKAVGTVTKGVKAVQTGVKGIKAVETVSKGVKVGETLSKVGKAIKTAGGKVKTFAMENPELSTQMASALIPSGKDKKNVQPIIEDEQKKIM